MDFSTRRTKDLFYLLMLTLVCSVVALFIISKVDSMTSTLEIVSEIPPLEQIN